MIILWAWERPEDLRLLDSDKFAVAFLAQTLYLQGEKLHVVPRQQALYVQPGTRLIAVTRIETQGKLKPTATQIEAIIQHVVHSLRLKSVTALQIDFDAQVSERDFYRALLTQLRATLDNKIPLSITALASFCLGDGWIADLPVDEAIPMIFRMGADSRIVKRLLAEGHDFQTPNCQHSYGIATDEPIVFTFVKLRRIYVFKGREQVWDKLWLERLWQAQR